MTILIGLAALFAFVIFIYVLGLIPNIWSNVHIPYYNFGDVFSRGIQYIGILTIIALFILMTHLLGLLIKSFLS